eukprot:3258264-Pyramimonas_sp.AAC.1
MQTICQDGRRHGPVLETDKTVCAQSSWANSEERLYTQDTSRDEYLASLFIAARLFRRVCGEASTAPSGENAQVG